MTHRFESHHEETFLWDFRPGLKMFKGLKFLIKIEEGMYYLCRDNNGGDQLHGHHASGLRICLCLLKKQVFL